MANANTERIAELIQDTWELPFINAVDTRVFAVERFKRKQNEGDHIEWKSNYAGNESTTSYFEDDELPEADHQKYVEFRRKVSQNLVMVDVSGLVEAATRGKGGFMRAFATESRRALEDLKKHIERQSISPTKTKASDIDSVHQILTAGGTYAGVDRDVYPMFNPYVFTADAGAGDPAPLALEMMEDVSAEMFEREANIDEIWMPATQWYDYGNIMESRRRWTNVTKLDAGWEALEYEGVPVIKVPGMQPGDVFFLDKSFWNYYVLENFKSEPRYPNRDAKQVFIKTYSQIVCRHTGKQARITNLA